MYHCKRHANSMAWLLTPPPNRRTGWPPHSCASNCKDRGCLLTSPTPAPPGCCRHCKIHPNRASAWPTAALRCRLKPKPGTSKPAPRGYSLTGVAVSPVHQTGSSGSPSSPWFVTSRVGGDRFGQTLTAIPEPFNHNNCDVSTQGVSRHCGRSNHHSKTWRPHHCSTCHRLAPFS
ncbi:MAG: hypothetical protein RLZ34_1949 [Pseudomonadota bacterium]